MSWLQALIISIVEGITEFLPISSTAHMKFTNPLIGVKTGGFVDLFEIVIQLAAILSVIVLFWKKFMNFKDFRFYIKLIVAVIPALIGGVLLKKHIDNALDNLTFIAVVMIAGGVLLLFVDRLFTKVEINEEEDISYFKALMVGCFQVLSILFPGLSRSAATIVGGMSQKLSRSVAAEFSFFLAVPTMFAASVKSFWDVYQDSPQVLSSNNLTILVFGGFIAFIVALLSVKLFIGYVQKHGFKIFGYYRIALGIVILALIYSGVSVS